MTFVAPSAPQTMIEPVQLTAVEQEKVVNKHFGLNVQKYADQKPVTDFPSNPMTKLSADQVSSMSANDTFLLIQSL